MSQKATFKLDKPHNEVNVEVEFEYSYDPGVRTYSNGDPGYPESEEISVEKVYYNGDILDIMDYYTYQQLIDELTEKISNYEREKT